MDALTCIYYLLSIVFAAGIGILLFGNFRGHAFRHGLMNEIEHMNLRNIFIIGLYFRLMEKGKRERVDIEIYEAISYMRNMASIGAGKSLSSDSLIEQLVIQNGILKKAYAKVLHLLRQNRKDEAIEYFANEAGTNISKDFARLLIKWDDINPGQLQETLLSHQKNIRQTRMTSLKSKAETVSDLIYLPVVVNIMLIFVNFIYIGYYIDQKEMLMVLL